MCLRIHTTYANVWVRLQAVIHVINIRAPTRDGTRVGHYSSSYSILGKKSGKIDYYYSEVLIFNYSRIEYTRKPNTRFLGVYFSQSPKDILSDFHDFRYTFRMADPAPTQENQDDKGKDVPKNQDDKGKDVPKKVAKPVAKGSGKSHVWKYFTAPHVPSEGKFAGKEVVTCVVPTKDGGVCGMQLTFQHSTTALGNHLNLVHSAVMAKVCVTFILPFYIYTQCAGQCNLKKCRQGAGQTAKCGFLLCQREHSMERTHGSPGSNCHEGHASAYNHFWRWIFGVL